MSTEKPRYIIICGKRKFFEKKTECETKEICSKKKNSEEKDIED